MAAPEQKWEYATQPVAGQFIVRFKDYKMAAEHKQALVDGVGDSKLWKYVDRNNAAARFPTDFALVEIDLDHVEELKASSSHPTLHSPLLVFLAALCSP